jgi:xanthine dehydrogenase molybdenum-binding subunit
MRGFGMPEIHVGLEQCVDDLARAIKMDPVQFRLKNCIKGGDTIVTGMTMHPTGLSPASKRQRSHQLGSQGCSICAQQAARQG